MVVVKLGRRTACSRIDNGAAGKRKLNDAEICRCRSRVGSRHQQDVIGVRIMDAVTGCD